MTFTYINRSHGTTISRTVSQVSRLVYMTFTYISISHGKTSLIVRNTYLLPYYAAYDLTVKRYLLEYRSN